MKATDLMIGDWVNYQPGDAPQYMKVGMVSGYDIQLDLYREGGIEVAAQVWFDEENYIQPIPLTPEILEKNGFDFGYTASEADFCSAVGCGYPEEKGWCFDEGAGEIKIIFPNDTDGGLIRLDDQCADRYLEFIFVKAIYVHELQHALRLCGIEKEIEL